MKKKKRSKSSEVECNPTSGENPIKGPLNSTGHSKKRKGIEKAFRRENLQKRKNRNILFPQRTRQRKVQRKDKKVWRWKLKNRPEGQDFRKTEIPITDKMEKQILF